MPLPESSNYLTDNEDLVWHLRHTVPWEELIDLVERNFTLPDGPETHDEAKEFYLQIMEEVGRYVAAEVAPRVEALDAAGTRLEDGEVVMPPEHYEIFDGFNEMGLHGLVAPRELGGMNCPLVLYFALAEVIARADCGTMTHFGFFGGIALTLLSYAEREGSLELEDGQLVKTRFQEQIEEIVAGEAWGAMVLTEPDAGSDLGAIRCKAVQDEAGVWRLTGEKIFITSGNGQHQIVLARTAEPAEGESGLEGLSLFLVPRWIERDGEKIENIKVTKAEKKLGHNSSPTVSLLYEESESELIGELGQGFELMLLLMNNARVAVGFEALGVCESAHRMAVKYAGERRTMGKAIKDHEMIADMLQEMDTTVRGIRALCFEALIAIERIHRWGHLLRYDPPLDSGARRALERKLKKTKRYARELTPLVKYLASEKSVELARMNMQIHGGMGYSKETGADRLLRDALVLPIYEGTSQIQALMALKDHLGAVMKDPAGFLAEAARLRVVAQTSRGIDRALAQAELKLHQSSEAILAKIVGSKVRHEWQNGLSHGSLMQRLDYLRGGFLRKWDAKRDFGYGMLHAERLTKILADVAVARVLVRQAKEHPEREVYARRHLARVLPRITALAMEIQGGPDLEDLLEHTEEQEASTDKVA